jgi:hypothetical protein
VTSMAAVIPSWTIGLTLVSAGNPVSQTICWSPADQIAAVGRLPRPRG